ncbi:thymidine kinase [Proboscivirus elephantidbeta4]|uniref:Thymidine kinase n=1 Tax=Elephant endotheliotropic herpesvirus 4 TaxID=548914 RepID=A0A0S1TPL4_9BETA|nr:thymidine kinase [Elephant endotheliotropic herpesvirus 4]ALM25999.1 thymidine kinase [Elephant endotheliotropic herpesvirus 4]
MSTADRWSRVYYYKVSSDVNHRKNMKKRDGTADEVKAAPAAPIPRTRNLTVYLEGCIGVGKTSLFKYAADNLPNLCTLYDEPMLHWTEWFPENVLETLYSSLTLPNDEDRQIRLFACQNMIATPFLAREAGCVRKYPAPYDPGFDTLSIADRHPSAPFIVFPLHQYLHGNFSYIGLYSMLWSFRQEYVDTIVVLLGEPEETLRRVRQRNRSVESGVTLEYIKSIQTSYNIFLNTCRLASDYIPPSPSSSSAGKRGDGFNTGHFLDRGDPDHNIISILYTRKPEGLPLDELIKLFKKITAELGKLVVIPVNLQRFVYKIALKKFTSLLSETPGVTSYFRYEEQDGAAALP